MPGGRAPRARSEVALNGETDAIVRALEGCSGCWRAVAMSDGGRYGGRESFGEVHASFALEWPAT